MTEQMLTDLELVKKPLYLVLTSKRTLNRRNGSILKLRLVKASQVCSNVKVLLTFFWPQSNNSLGIFTPSTKSSHLGVSFNLLDALARTTLLMQQFLTKLETVMMPQQPNSPEMAPNELSSSSKAKRHTKDNTCFKSQTELRRIPSKSFHECFQN